MCINNHRIVKLFDKMGIFMLIGSLHVEGLRLEEKSSMLIRWLYPSGLFFLSPYSGVPNNHTGMLIYFGQKCRGVLCSPKASI